MDLCDLRAEVVRIEEAILRKKALVDLLTRQGTSSHLQ